MKTFHASLAAQYAAETSTLAQILRVVRLDGQTFRWTTHDQHLLVASALYLASPGLRLTSIHNTSDLAVNTLDATVFCDNATDEELEAGVWDEATVQVMELDWSDPPDALDTRVNVLMAGTLGPIKRQNLTATVSVHGLTDMLNRRIGRTYSATCPYIHDLWDGSTFVASVECGADLTGLIADVTVSGVNVDAPRRTFSDTALTSLADGFFNEGSIAFLTGANAGLVRKVRAWEGLTFYLYNNFPYDVEAGDTGKAVHGDDKSFATCKNVFNNIANFGGDVYIPGMAAVLSSPTNIH